jgi:hypothetical protein
MAGEQENTSSKQETILKRLSWSVRYGGSIIGIESDNEGFYKASDLVGSISNLLYCI